MPVVACLKCPAQLKIPDGSKGHVRCPKCGTIFPIAASKTAFGVVSDNAHKTAPKPNPMPAKAVAEDDEPDFEIVDTKPARKTKRDDDRSKSKRRGDDDDDDGDRTRKKKRTKRWDDEDEEDWQPQRSGKRAEFDTGKIAALLLSISFWLNLGAFGLLTLSAVVLWILFIAGTGSTSGGGRGGGNADGTFLDVIVILPGLLGLGAWVVGTIGCAFAIAGPAKAQAMAITATVLSVVHVILIGVTFGNSQDVLGFDRSLSGAGKAGWVLVASALPALDAFLPLLLYQPKAVRVDYVVMLLAGVCEVLRLVFALLALKRLAAAARDYAAAEASQFGVQATCFTVGGTAIGCLLMTILLAEVGDKTAMHLLILTIVLTMLAYTFMMLPPALAAQQTKNACNHPS